MINYFIYLFLLIIYFPFIPAIVPSSDTQPTLTIVYILFLCTIVLFSRRWYIYKIEKKCIFVFLTICIFVSIISLIINKFIYGREIFWTRVYSFVQFIIAIIISSRIKDNISKRQIFIIFSVYVIFTLIFLLSNGYLEKILIYSRVNFIIGSGRGVSTLSPEPSFFAIQIFNILLISYFIVGWKEDVKFHNINLSLAAVCFISSLSGYGLIFLMILLLIRFPKIFLFMMLILFIFISNFYEFIESVSYTRAGSLILNFFNNNFDSLLEADASFYSRYTSFMIYLESIYSNILLGEGYSIFEGGGFISVISAFGFIYIIFFSLILLKILTLHGVHYKIRLLLLVWLAMNILSGPIGIPTVGFIIGLILFRKENSIELTSSKNFKIKEIV